mgnify:FL=1
MINITIYLNWVMIMNNKGFTLVELLAVIAVIGIIAIIAIPKMVGTSKTNKDMVYETNLKQIEKVAREYVASNPDVMSEDEFRISLELLCNKKYLECPILDVRDDSVMNGYVLVTYDSNTNSYNYEYKSE